MAGWRIFAAIVLSVLTPFGGALLVYQTAIWLSYGPEDIILLLKGLIFVFAISLTVIFIAVFCGSFDRHSDPVPDKRKNRK